MRALHQKLGLHTNALVGLLQVAEYCQFLSVPALRKAKKTRVINMLFLYPILTFSVMYRYTDARQHRTLYAIVTLSMRLEEPIEMRV